MRREQTGSTHGSDEHAQNRWRARPVLATGLRALIIAVPLGAAYGASVLATHVLAGQIRDSRWWLVLALVLSVAVCAAVERITRRLLPLAALLKLSMLFPDQAPNRFRIARGAASTKLLTERVATARTRDAAQVAEAVLELITAMTAHDRRTRGHCERTRVFVDLLGEQLRLPRDARDKLRWAALLHDVGKLEVAPSILNKPAKLSDAEFELVAQHPANGEQLLGALGDWLGEWGHAVRQHHERFDGSGYPDGVAGTDISRAARIVAIADSFEVMTAHRAYKKPMATVAARAELARCAGTHFDPAYVRAFLSISLPRLLWAMGPGALLMNIPMLRVLADTTPKALAAAPQGAAAAAVVAAGLTATVTPAALAATSPASAISAPAPAASSGGLAAVGTGTSTTSVGHPTPGATKPTPGAASTPTARGSDGSGPSSIAVSSAPVASTDGPTSPPATVTNAPPPTVHITSAPSGTTNSRTAVVQFTSASGAAATWCSLDSGAARSCSGGTFTVDNLADGGHSVAVWATDARGQAGPVQSVHFVVDATAPVLTWTAAPPAAVVTSAVSSTFHVDDQTARVTCRLDAGNASACSGAANFASVGDGTHTIVITAVDAVGNQSTLSASVTVATQPPVLTTKPPSTILLGNTASVGWTPVAGLTYEYSVDGAAWTTTTSTTGQTVSVSVLGSHSIAIRAVDSLGNHTNQVSASFNVIL